MRPARPFAALLPAGLLLAAALLTASARADTLTDIFHAGNEAYFRGDYDAARDAYERLVELGVHDPDVFYDLGLSHERAGHRGRAIAAYERALRLRPGDGEVRTALDRCRAALAHRRADREGEAIVESGPSIGEAIFGSVGEDTLAVLLLCLESLFFLALALWPRARREQVRLGLGIAAPLLGVAALTAGLGLAVRSGAFDEGAPAIVVRDQAVLREGPRDDAQERGRAREGERAFVVERDGDWARVTLGGGRRGWMPAPSLVPIGER